MRAAQPFIRALFRRGGGGGGGEMGPSPAGPTLGLLGMGALAAGSWVLFDNSKYDGE